MSSRGAQQALLPGRIVITLNQRSGLPELGVVCGTPPASPASAAFSSMGTKNSGFGALQPSNGASSTSAPAGENDHALLITIAITCFSTC